ncbi:MAG: MFS transporter [Alphaproteobacteria bacterium]|nr:MFS transporter [Alphaproteobacteria bacterium]
MDPAPPSVSPALSERRFAFRVLFGALLVVGVGNSMLFAILPPLGRELGLDDWGVGAIFSLSALIWVFASPRWGRISDRRGRKVIIATGLFAYALSMSLFALVTMAGQAQLLGAIGVFVGLALARAVFGAVGSAASPAAQAYVADYTRSEERTNEIGSLTAAFALGSALGPGLCALVAAEIGLVAPIWLVAGLAILGGLAVMRFLPGGGPPAPGATPPRERGETWRLARDRRVSGHLIYGLGLSLVAGIHGQTYAFYTMDRLGLTGALGAEAAAAGFMVGALAVLATQLGIVPRLSLSNRLLMATGAALAALGLLLQAFASSLPTLLASQLFFGIGVGLARPGFAGGASTAASPQEQGAVAGLVVAANGAGFVISPLFGGLAYQTLGMTAPLWIATALLTAMALFGLRSRRLAAPGWEG